MSSFSESTLEVLITVFDNLFFYGSTIPSNSLLSMASTMTDEQRDQIDRDVADFIRLSSDVVKILKAEGEDTF